jgi:hypothetical protein
VTERERGERERGEQRVREGRDRKPKEREITHSFVIAAEAHVAITTTKPITLNMERRTMTDGRQMEQT